MMNILYAASGTYHELMASRQSQSDVRREAGLIVNQAYSGRRGGIWTFMGPETRPGPRRPPACWRPFPAMRSGSGAAGWRHSRKGGGLGKGLSVGCNLGGRSQIKKKKRNKTQSN